MTSKRKFRLIGVVTMVGIVVLWLSTSLGQRQKNYQVETHVYATPEYKTDAARAIDAYERVMERYMDVTERNFAALSADIKVVDTKLNAIDVKLAKLDERLERIERHLGTIPAPLPDPNKARILGPEPTTTDPDNR